MKGKKGKKEKYDELKDRRNAVGVGEEDEDYDVDDDFEDDDYDDDFEDDEFEEDDEDEYEDDGEDGDDLVEEEE